MLPTPKKFFLTVAAAEGNDHLTAFDNALLAGRIGNLNLLRVTSILPPGAVLCEDLEIPYGSLVPTAYGYITSDEPGTIISAAVGIGFGKDSFGVIMEHAMIGTREEALETVERMIREAFITRGMEMEDIKIAAVQHRVEKIGCVLAAVPMWY